MRVTWFSPRLQVLPNEEVLLQVATDQIFRLVDSGLPLVESDAAVERKRNRSAAV